MVRGDFVELIGGRDDVERFGGNGGVDYVQ